MGHAGRGREDRDRPRTTNPPSPRDVLLLSPPRFLSLSVAILRRRLDRFSFSSQPPLGVTFTKKLLPLASSLLFLMSFRGEEEEEGEIRVCRKTLKSDSSCFCLQQIAVPSLRRRGGGGGGRLRRLRRLLHSQSGSSSSESKSLPPSHVSLTSDRQRGRRTLPPLPSIMKHFHTSPAVFGTTVVVPDQSCEVSEVASRYLSFSPR